MTNIDRLLNKYDKDYVPGEVRSNEYNNNIRKDIKRKDRHLILDTLLNEAKPFTLNKNQVKMVRFLIDSFSDDLKQFHRQSKTETIILAFMLYVKKLENPRACTGNYRIFQTNSFEAVLTDKVFEIIVCRLCLRFMESTPIKPRISNTGYHDVFVREGLR